MATPEPQPSHPLRNPWWVAFALGVLAVPLGGMAPESWWRAPEPLPHLARLPDLRLVDATGASAPLKASLPAFVDLTTEPCGPACVARTGLLAGLVHSGPRPSMVSVLAGAPTEHPVLLAAQPFEEWRVAWLAPNSTQTLSTAYSAWTTARPAVPEGSLPAGGVMLVDATGSIRGLFAATDAGQAQAVDAWFQLQAEFDTPKGRPAQ